MDDNEALDKVFDAAQDVEMEYGCAFCGVTLEQVPFIIRSMTGNPRFSSGWCGTCDPRLGRLATR